MERKITELSSRQQNNISANQENSTVKHNKIHHKIPKLEGEINHNIFKTWKESWNDFYKLARVNNYRKTP